LTIIAAWRQEVERYRSAAEPLTRLARDELMRVYDARREEHLREQRLARLAH
jgi:hypothetical protein